MSLIHSTFFTLYLIAAIVNYEITQLFTDLAAQKAVNEGIYVVGLEEGINEEVVLDKFLVYLDHGEYVVV